jgi:hypothetical protein
MIVSKAQGQGSARVRSIRAWILDFVRMGRLPLYSYCHSRQTVLEDEGVLQELQGALMEKAKAGFLKAEDVCEVIASEGTQTLFAQLGINKPRISQSTAKRWLAKMRWRYSQKKNGMFIDGHEREDVVAYPINRPLSIDGRNMNCDSIVGMTMGIPFHWHLPARFPSSLSHMISPRSSKMTKGRPAGVTKTAIQPPNRKAMANR